MKFKIITIWKIITSEHYLLLTGSGSIMSRLPKSLGNLKVMKDFEEKAVAANNDDVSNSATQEKI